MKKTLELMKSNGLFDSLVQGMIQNDMDIDDLNCILETIMVIDSNLEDAFLEDCHVMGIKTIFEALNKTVYEHEKVEALNKVDPKKLMNIANGNGDKHKNVVAQINDLLTQVMNLMSAM